LKTNELGEIDLPRQVLCNGQSEEDLIADIFGEELKEKKYYEMREKVILAPTNKQVDAINNAIIQKYLF
jgi:SOS-response transcriptional repressor LexA